MTGIRYTFRALTCCISQKVCDAATSIFLEVILTLHRGLSLLIFISDRLIQETTRLLKCSQRSVEEVS
jgi:hypothetical protein